MLVKVLVCLRAKVLSRGVAAVLASSAVFPVQIPGAVVAVQNVDCNSLKNPSKSINRKVSYTLYIYIYISFRLRNSIRFSNWLLIRGNIETLAAPSPFTCLSLDDELILREAARSRSKSPASPNKVMFKSPHVPTTWIQK